MAFNTFFACVFIFCSCNCIFSTTSDKNTSEQHDLNVLLDDVIDEIPRKETSKFMSQLFEKETDITEKKIAKPKQNHFTVLPTREKFPTKKSNEAFPNAALSVALTTPSVYLVQLGSHTQVENVQSQEINKEKRFKIPQFPFKPNHKNTQPNTNNSMFTPGENAISLDPQKATMTKVDTNIPEYRMKRQSILNQGLPIMNPGNSVVPVQSLNTIVPVQSDVRNVGMTSDVTGINSNKVVAVVPVKVETPLTVAPPSSVTMISQMQATEPSVLGTVRSTLPVTAAIQPFPDISESTTAAIIPTPGNLLFRLGNQQNWLTNTPNNMPRKEDEAIKLAQVPLSLFRDKTRNIDDTKMEKANSETKIVGDPTDHLWIKPLRLEGKNAERKPNMRDTQEQSSDDINRETLKTLQSKLTKIISKLEAKVSKKNGNSMQTKKKESLSKLAKNKPSEKSLKLLKHRLSHVLEKFNSKPGAGQPFTIGKEWVNVLKSAGTRDSGDAIKPDGSTKTKNTTDDEGNWPSIASQLLRKLNKALVKLQEQRVVRSLAKDAVMYFSFDKPKKNNEYAIQDKSGHFNDASVYGKAHASSRAYGSCGKALIFNSGNLRFFDKYTKNKPTKAITLAMWVRTNATGYVKWFVRDSSREFNTHTQFPLVHKNVWTHLSGTFNGSTGVTRIYVDGELTTEKVNQRQESIPADFTPAGIGPAFGDTSLIAIDEVYMFARALDPREVRTLYDNCEFNRMVLHYGFQKINRSAGLVFDQSGLHNDGHLQGDAHILDSGCDKCGSCLDLNAGGNPRLTIEATHFKHIPTKAISVGAWFTLNSTIGTHPLFRVTEPVLHSTLLDLVVTDGKLQWIGYNKELHELFNVVTAQVVVPEGVWVHILATFDSLHGEAKIFIDGHKKADVITSKKVPIGEDWDEIKIGGRKSSRVQASGGYIDELVLYNWELEPSEISYIMKYCPDHPKLVSFTVHVPLD